MKRGKKYTEAAKLVDRATQYDVAEAISLVKKTAVAKSNLRTLKIGNPYQFNGHLTKR